MIVSLTGPSIEISSGIAQVVLDFLAREGQLIKSVSQLGTNPAFLVIKSNKCRSVSMLLSVMTKNTESGTFQVSIHKSWLSDGDSQILRLYVFVP